MWGGAAEPPFLPVGRRLPLEKTDRPRALAYEAAAHAEGGKASADTTAWQMGPLGLLGPWGHWEWGNWEWGRWGLWGYWGH